MPVNNILAFGVTRIRITFADDLGSTPRVAEGTGFYLDPGEEQPLTFVTNRHNIDPRMSSDMGPRWRTQMVELELRETIEGRPRIFTPEVTWCTVENLATAVFADDAEQGPDCALIVDPQFRKRPPQFRSMSAANRANLVGAEEFEERFSLGDAVSFVGFPSIEGKPLWDTEWTFPISRPAWVASFPGIPYNNPKIGTADVLLVSGLSFSGSSGSGAAGRRRACGARRRRAGPR